MQRTMYVAEDDFWKIMNYETQLDLQRGDLYKKAGIKMISRQTLKRRGCTDCTGILFQTMQKLVSLVRAAQVYTFW